MKFLSDNINKDNLMLINIIHHRGKKATNYNDYLDIVYKEIDTGRKVLKTIECPEMEIYFAKEDKRNYDYNKSFFHICDADMKTFKFKDIQFAIAKEAGQEYMGYIKNCLNTGNRSAINNIHKYKYVFGSDYDIENWYRVQWLFNYDNKTPKHISKSFADIEVDGINFKGIPTKGECPINAVTLVDNDTKTCYTFLLRNDKNPQIQEFEDTIDDFISSLHEAFDESYGSLDYKMYMYDEKDEDKLIIDLFKLINTIKRDFLLFWNMGYDIPYIIARCKELGLDPVEVMCNKDFKMKELFYVKDTLHFKIDEKSDYFKISSYTVFSDQMLNYAGVRKGQSEIRSFKLGYVGEKELSDTKLDYHEEANIKTLPYVNYKKFVMYNIKDVLLQMGIERKTNDVDNIYSRAYGNGTVYHKVFKQTIFLKNRAYIDYFKQGLIIGNNTNIDYGVKYERSKDDNDDDDEKFDGALVADSRLNEPTGIKLLGTKSMFIFRYVVDMDFSSMYPHIIIAFNIAPNCMVGKLILNTTVEDLYNVKDIDNDKYDAGKDFVDNLLINNPAMLGSKWFNLPNMDALHEKFKDYFEISNKLIFKIDESMFKKHYLEKLNIEINL